MTQLDVSGSIFGKGADLGSYEDYINYQPQKPPLLVRAARKYAQSKAATEAQKREADAATMGVITSDIQQKMIAEQEKFDKLDAAIKQAEMALQPPPALQNHQMNTGDYVALALQALAGGTNQLGESAAQIMARRQQEAALENQNAQDQWRYQTGMAQDQIENLRRMQGNAYDSAQEYDRLGLQTQINEYDAMRKRGWEVADQQAAFDQRNKEIEDRANNAESAALRGKALDAYYKGKDLGVRRQAWNALAQLGDYSLPEPTMATYEEELGRAKIENTKAGTQGKVLDNRLKAGTLDAKIAKAKADVQAVLSRTRLTDAQRQNIVMRTSLLRPESQAKVANLYSLIKARGDTQGKPATIQNYNSLLKVLNEDYKLKALNPFADPAELDTLAQEIGRVDAERSRLVKARVYGNQGGLGGSITPFQPDLPPGLANGDPAPSGASAGASMARAGMMGAQAGSKKTTSKKRSMKVEDARSRFGY